MENVDSSIVRSLQSLKSSPFFPQSPAKRVCTATFYGGFVDNQTGVNRPIDRRLVRGGGGRLTHSSASQFVYDIYLLGLCVAALATVPSSSIWTPWHGSRGLFSLF